LPLPLFAWGFGLLRRRGLARPLRRAGWLLVALLIGALFFACLPVNDSWPLPTGLGGLIGDGLSALPFMLAGTTGTLALSVALGTLAAAGTLMALARSADWNILRGGDGMSPADTAPAPRRAAPADRGDEDDDEAEGLLARI